MGGGTGMVGDPSFKDEARQLMTIDTIESNIASIKRVFSNYLTYGDGPKDALMINNAEWLRSINYLEFLRDVGRHFSVNRMLSFDSVKTRLDREQSLSFLEFNYMILQAYDFVELAQALRLPSADGRFGPVGQHRQRHRPRSPHGDAAALRADLAAADDRFRCQDGQVRDGRRLAQCRHALGLRLLAVLAQHRRRRRLALPEALHDAADGRGRPPVGARRPGGQRGQEDPGDRGDRDPARPPRVPNRQPETARKTFEEGGLAENLPSVEVPAAELDAGIGLLSLIVRAGLAASNGEARRHVQGGAVRINDQAVSDERRIIGSGEITADGVIKLSLGKKKHILIRRAA